ncbi:MAG: hypothetical protein ABEJ61_01345 [Haloferacaceae archaeon]
MASSQEEFEKDQIFDVLSSARRRYTIYYLRERDEEVPITELAKQVAAWEYEIDPEELTDKQQKRVYVSLYQTHLPKLAELGIVDYDKDRGVVAAAEKSRVLDAHLTREGDRDPQWHLGYLALAAVDVLLLVAAMLDVWVFAAVDEGLLGVLVVASFAALAGAQELYQRRSDRAIPEELQVRD